MSRNSSRRTARLSPFFLTSNITYTQDCNSKRYSYKIMLIPPQMPLVIVKGHFIFQLNQLRVIRVMVVQILEVGAQSRTLNHLDYNTNQILLQISTIYQHQYPPEATVYLYNKNHLVSLKRGDTLPRSSDRKSSSIIAFRQLKKWRTALAEISSGVLSRGWKVMSLNIWASLILPQTQTYDTQAMIIACHLPIIP